MEHSNQGKRKRNKKEKIFWLNELKKGISVDMIDCTNNQIHQNYLAVYKNLIVQFRNYFSNSIKNY
jgi:hypothetical protein